MLDARSILHDAWIPESDRNAYEPVKDCEATVVILAHSAYKQLDLIKSKGFLQRLVLVDGRKLFDFEYAHW